MGPFPSSFPIHDDGEHETGLHMYLHEDFRVRYQFIERVIFKAETLPEFDEAYTRLFLSNVYDKIKK